MKVLFDSSIDSAYAASGERYADSENASIARRCAPIAPANGRDPVGLAPVDLALDGSLRPGDLYLSTITPTTFGAARYFSSTAARAAERFSGVSRQRFSAKIIQQ